MLMAADNTIVPLDSSVPVTVTVLDINDNPPIFSRSVMDVSVQENTNGTTVSEISVSEHGYVSCDTMTYAYMLTLVKL